MKILLLYDFPSSCGGLTTQAELLYKGLVHLGVDCKCVNFESPQEKEWYYRWYKPDIVVGVGYWGHTPDLVMHPQKFSMLPVPWLVADGYIAAYHDVLNSLPLILVTSNWVKEMYRRDGVREANISVLPVGVDTDKLIIRDKEDPKVLCVREALGVSPDEILILTIGGDAASKGAQEVLQALTLLDEDVPPWRYVCKVWPQGRTVQQNLLDLQLAATLGLEKKVTYTTGTLSREFIPYLLAACDIYAAPSRLEGFGMPHIEAGACGKPVIGIKAMGPLDTLVHDETALLANVSTEVRVNETLVGDESTNNKKKRIVFDVPRTVDYRASIYDIAQYLNQLLKSPEYRQRLGTAGRERVVKCFDYRVVAKQFVGLIQSQLGVS